MYLNQNISLEKNFKTNVIILKEENEKYSIKSLLIIKKEKWKK